MTRRAGIVVTIIASVLIVAVAVGTLVWMTLTRQGRAQQNVVEAVVVIERADEVVTNVDDIVLEEITTSTVEPAQTALDRLDGAKADLTEAAELLELAAPDLRRNDARRVEALVESVESRVQMLELAGPILEATIQASSAMRPHLRGINALAESQRLSNQAIQNYNTLRKANVEKALQLDKQAAAKATEAKEEFAAAKEAFPEIDVAEYLSIASARAELLKLSQRIDTLWLSGKTEEANALLKQFNTKDAALTKRIDQLPDNDTQVIATAYVAAADGDTKAYFGAREKARKADDRAAALEE